jgi:hypothetical protein
LLFPLALPFLIALLLFAFPSDFVIHPPLALGLGPSLCISCVPLGLHLRGTIVGWRIGL